MSPSWLGAIGRAQPAITQAMHDIQERPKQETRFGWEQEEMGMKREQFGQTKAVNKETLNRMEYDRKQRQVEEERKASPWMAEDDLMFIGWPDEQKNKALNMLQKTGVINEKFQGTMDGRDKMVEMIQKTPPIFQWVGNVEKMKYGAIKDKAREVYTKLSQTPGADPEKVEKAKQDYMLASKTLSDFTGQVDKITEIMETGEKYGRLLDSIKRSDTWKTLSPEEKGSLELGAIEALETGSTKGWEEAVKNVVKKENAKQITPSWKVVQDPKSSTGYSYQDMNNPTGELRTGAPAPSSAKEKEKTFKDKQIEVMWPKLSDDEKKKVVGAGIDPHELTEKNILDMYGNIMTDPNVRKSIQGIAEEIIKRATQKPIGKVSAPGGKVVNELPKGAKLQGYGADGKKIYEVPPAKPGGKPTYIKEQ